MSTCSHCQGEGFQTYEEDGRMVRDSCYHCAESGEVDEDTDFLDRLVQVAATLAYQVEREYRQACNNDPDGDGYDLCAAENGLSSFDYFRCRVWERTDTIAAQLGGMPREMQEVLVAWNEQPIA